MGIMHGNTFVVVGRDPDAKDQEFFAQVKYWHVQWVKDGRPPSKRGI